MMTSRSVLLIAAGLLLVGIGVSVWAGMQTDAVQPWVSLASRMPMNINGWHGEDVPLGETEAVRNAVATLNYNDYLYRVYRKGRKEVFVYAMFWRQGRISVREMAGHTPDGCWIASGAQYCAPPRQVQFVIGNLHFLAGEVRGFQFPGGQQIEVVWWHLWGGELVDRDYSIKSIVPLLREIREWLIRRGGHKRDQLMVRIHGADNIEELIRTPPATVFLSGLPVVYRVSAQPHE